jgi:hypothetical protein
MSTQDYPNPLTHENDNDYVLDEGARSVWITVDDISVYIHRTDEGVVVDLYALGVEADDCLGSTYAFNDEAKALIDELESPVEGSVITD